MTTVTTHTDHAIRRLRIPLGRGYREAVAAFERTVPLIDPRQFQSLSSWEHNRALFENLAPLGLMRFASVDVQAYLRTSGTDRPGVEYLAGNHTIAERMYRHEPAAMLYAPLRLFLFADDSGDGVLLIDQPSTLIDSISDNPDVAAVGRELDAKVAAVLTAMGVDVPSDLVHDLP
jgi:uncharacterized protein (DUF302 family)